MDTKPSEIWPCPKCYTSGMKNNVVMKQINCGEALYICEGKDCLYPLEALKKFPIISREVGSIPVDENLIEKLSLPESLIKANLTESQINDIVEINSLIPRINQIQETKQAWDSFVQRMLMEGEEVPSEYLQYRDADLVKLDNIQPSLKPYLFHLFSDSDEKV